MSFSLSSTNIAINSNGFLSAECKDLSGVYRASAINLNNYLGNINGVFQWGSQAFSATANSLTVSGATLSGQLQRANGTWTSASVNLDEHIMNDNGVLKYT